MTGPPGWDPLLRDLIARWLADDCHLIAGPYWAELTETARARYRLAAVDLLTGPLAGWPPDTPCTCHESEETTTP